MPTIFFPLCYKRPGRTRKQDYSAYKNFGQQRLKRHTPNIISIKFNTPKIITLARSLEQRQGVNAETILSRVTMCLFLMVNEMDSGSYFKAGCLSSRMMMILFHVLADINNFNNGQIAHGHFGADPHVKDILCSGDPGAALCVDQQSLQFMDT